MFLSLGGHSSLNGVHYSRKEFAPLNGVHYSRKEFAPRGANSFLEEETLLRREANKGKIVELFHPMKVHPFTIILFITNMLAVADLILIIMPYIMPLVMKLKTPCHLIG